MQFKNLNKPAQSKTSSLYTENRDFDCFLTPLYISRYCTGIIIIIVGAKEYQNCANYSNFKLYYLSFYNLHLKIKPIQSIHRISNEFY